MTLLADWLQTLGTATLGALWAPLLAWTALAFAAMSLLRLWRSAHTLVHYTTRTALRRCSTVLPLPPPFVAGSR